MSVISTSCEEVSSARGVQSGASSEVWSRYRVRGPGDVSEEELVKRYLPLVRSAMGRLALSLPAHAQTDDLYSAGLTGLLSAVRQYNPGLGTSFESYARTRIRGAMLDELRRMDWVPRSVHAKARKIQKAMGEVEHSLGRVPTDEETAAALQVSVSEYRRWLDEVRPISFVSLDAVQNPDGDEDYTEHEAVTDVTDSGTFERVARAELARVIATRIEQLSEVQRKVIALYYYEGLRLREIADIFGLCESRICQIHTQAILSIRSYLESLEAHA